MVFWLIDKKNYNSLVQQHSWTGKRSFSKNLLVGENLLYFIEAKASSGEGWRKSSSGSLAS